jgi:ribonuclease PH
MPDVDTKSRSDGRSDDAPRPVAIDLGAQKNPEGSVLYRAGGTTVLCAASVEDGVRDFLRGSGKGWVTAEYAMHPRANPRRQPRDGRRGAIDGRAQEIQRLVGRALRAAVVPENLGERTVTNDCDVLDADGGTRTASVTGGFVALAIALDKLRRQGTVGVGVLREPLAAVSVGWVRGRAMLDLCYEEDHKAEVDLNVVATESGAIVEVQGTAEGEPLSKDRFDAMVDLAIAGTRLLVVEQRKALVRAGVDLGKLLG